MLQIVSAYLGTCLVAYIIIIVSNMTPYTEYSFSELVK